MLYTIHLKDWDDQGWIGIKNIEWFKRAAYLLRRTAITRFKWVKGHSGDWETVKEATS
jgi:ribonuclease HI